MKNFKRKFIMAIFTIVSTLGIAFGFMLKPVKAEIKQDIAISYKTYSVADYEQWSTNKEDFYGYVESWFAYFLDSDSSGTFNYTIGSSDAADIAIADADWADVTVFESPDATKSCYEYFGGNPLDLLGVDVTKGDTYDLDLVVTKKGKTTTKTYSYELSYLPKQTSDFAPGNSLVIEAFATMTGAKIAGATVNLGIGSITTKIDQRYYDSELKSETKEGDAFKLGWQYTQAATKADTPYESGDTISLGAAKITLDKGYAGSFDIGMNSSSGTEKAKSYSFDSNSTSYKYSDAYDAVSNPTATFSYTETKKSINIIGATADTDVEKITINSATYTVGSSSTSDITINPNVTIGSDTACPSYTVEHEVSGSSFSIDGTIKNLGKVTAVKYADTLANAISGSGTKAGSLAQTSGPYTIPLTAFGSGDTIQMAVEVTASNDTTKKWVNISIKKESDKTAILENISFAITAPSGTTYSIEQTPSGTAGFSDSVISYKLYVPSDVTKIVVTPTFDATVDHHQTSEVFNNVTSVGTPASGAPVNVTSVANGDTIVVTMTAQAGSSYTKTYTFTINHLSSNTVLTKLSYVAKDASSGNTASGDATWNSTTSTFEITNLPFETATIRLTPTFPSGAKGWEFDGAALDKTYKDVAVSNPTPNDYTAYNFAKDFVVTAGAGNTETYHVSISRNKANDKNTINKLDIKYTDPITGASVTKNATITSTTISVSGIPYSLTSFVIVATLDETKFATWEVSGDSTIYASGGTSNPQSLAVSTGDADQYTKTITVTPQFKTSTETYTLELNKDASNNDVAVTKVEVSYTDPVSGSTVTKQAGLTSTTYTVEDVPFKVNGVTVKVTLNNTTTTKWDIGGSKYLSTQTEAASFTADAEKAVEINKTLTITPEDPRPAAVATFSLVIKRKAADLNTKLDSLTIISNDGTSYGTFNTATQQFEISDSGNYKFAYTVSFATVAASLTGLSAIEIYDGTTKLTNGKVTFSGIVDDSHNVRVVITPEYGTSVTVPVVVVRGGADNDTEYTITTAADITQATSGTAEAELVSSTATKVTYKVDYGTSRVVIDVNVFKDALHTDPSTSTVLYVNKTGTKLSAANNYVDFSATNYAAQTKTLTVYFYTSAYPYSNSTSPEALKLDIEVKRNAADSNNNFSFDITNTSGASYQSLLPYLSSTDPEITRSINSTTNTYSYIIDVNSSVIGFTDNKFKISATTVSTTSEMYWSDNSGDLLKYKLDPSDEFLIGTYPSKTTFYLTCLAQNQGKKTVTIEAITPDDRNPDNTITNITADNIATFTFSPTNYNNNKYTVDYSTDKVKFTVTKNVNVSKMTYKVNGVTKGTNLGYKAATADTADITLAANATTKVEIFLTAERDDVAGSTYVIEITRNDGSTLDYLQDIKVSGTSLLNNMNGVTVLENYSQSSSTMVFVYDASSTQGSLEFTTSPKAKFIMTDVTNNPSSPSSGDTDTDPFKYENFGLSTSAPTQIKIDVYSEKNKSVAGALPRTYNIYIYAANQDHSISSLELFKDSTESDYIFDVNNATYDYLTATTSTTSPFTVPFAGNSSMYVSVKTPLGVNSAVTVNGGSNYDVGLTSSVKKVTVEVISQLGQLLGTSSSLYSSQVTKHEFYVKRNPASTVSTLDSLVIIGGGSALTYKEGAFSSSTKHYTIDNLPDSITSIEYTYIATDSKSTVTPSRSTPYTFVDLSATVGESITFKVYSEEALDAQSKGLTSTNISTYEVSFSRTPVVLESNHDITSLIAYDSDANYYIGATATQQFSQSTPVYVVDLPASYAGATIQIEKATAKSTHIATVEYDGVSSNLIADGKEKNLMVSFVVNVDPGTEKLVKFSVIAEDTTSSGEYQIKVKRADFEDIYDLSLLTYNGTENVALVDGKYKYEVKVPYSVETVYLTGTPKSTKASITANDAPQSDPYALQVGQNQLVISVISEKKTVQPYSVTFVRDEISTLSDLKLLDAANDEIVGEDNNPLLVFDPDEAASKNYEVNLPYEIEKITLAPTLAATDPSLIKLEFSGKGINALTGEATVAEGSTTYKITLTPNSKINPQVYTVKVNRTTGNVDNFIESYKYFKNDNDRGDDTKIVELGVSRTKFKYEYVVNRNITIFDPEIIVSQNATFELPASTNIIPGQKNEFKVVVLSQTKVKQEYEFVVYSASEDNAINNIQVLNKENGTDIVDSDEKSVAFDKDTINYTLTVPFSTKNIFLNVEASSASATLKISKDGGSTYTDFAPSIQELTEGGTTTFKVYALSEYGKIANNGVVGRGVEYQITITQLPANGDSRIDALSIEFDGKTLTWDATLDDSQASGTSETYAVNFENIGDTVTSIKINANPTVSSSTVSGVGIQTLESLAVSSGTTTGYVFTYKVVVKSEKGNENTYNISVSRGPLDLDSDNNINYISLKDSNTVEYLGKDAWVDGQQVYEVTIPYGPQSYTIAANKTLASKSSTNGAGQFKIEFNGQDDYYMEHKVSATSVKGVKGTEYTIKVTVKAPSYDNKLSSITIGGDVLTGFDPEVTTYKYPADGSSLDNSIDFIDILATKSDSKATMTGDTGTVALQPGSNTFTISVTAEAGGTPKTYTIIVNKAYPDPELFNLAVEGEKFYSIDNLKQEIKFDEKLYGTTYYARIPNSTDTINITATLKETDKYYAISTSANVSSISNIKGSLDRTFKATPAVGTTTYNFTVKSSQNTSKTYIIVVVRSDKTMSSTDIDTASLGFTVPKDYTDRLAELTDDAGNPLYSSVKDLTTDILRANNGEGSFGTYLIPNSQTTLPITFEMAATVAGVDGATFEPINNDDLKVGHNIVAVKFTSADGFNTKTVLIDVVRDEYEYETLVDEIAEFDQDDIPQLGYTVNADTRKLNVTVVDKNPSSNYKTNPLVEVIGIEASGDSENGKAEIPLSVGENQITLKITSYRIHDGEKKVDNVETVSFKVTREAYDVAVAETKPELGTADIHLTAINSDNTETPLTTDADKGIKIEKADNYLASVTVPSTITQLGANIIDHNKFGDDAKIEVENGGKLLPGKSTEVTFKITSADGNLSETYTIIAYREPMKFDVKTPVEEYTLTKDTNREGYYELNLDTKAATVIEDYKEFIVFDKNVNNLDVEVLSEITAKTSEVILKVSNHEDPNEIEYVHLVVTTTANAGGTTFDIIFWIILGISIVLLIIILICVNRDKYGSVSKNRKRA